MSNELKPKLTASDAPGLQTSRRQFVMGTGAVLLSMGTLSLFGCGGSGGRTSGFAMKSFSGHVVVPAGVDATKLAVGAGLGTQKVTGDAVAGSAPSDAPSLVTVFDSTTKTAIYLGMTDPSSSVALNLDATSTAVALLFFSLGGSSMARNGMKPLVDAIKTNAATATLAAVIAARVSANPFAIGQGDAQIATALQTAAQAIAPGIKPMSEPRLRPFDAPTLLLIQPSGEVDGVTFVQDNNITGFAVQNSKRRMGYVYTYLTGHVDANGVSTAVNPPLQVGSVLEIPATKSLLNLASGWAPVTTATVPLKIQGSDTQSIYTSVFLTQVYGASEPAFFSDPMWAAELGKWRSSLSDLGKDTLVSYFTNIILSAVGFGGLAWVHAQLAAAIVPLMTIPSIGALIESAAGGNVLLAELSKFCIQDFLANDIVSLGVLKDMSTLVEVLSEQAASYLAAGASTVTGLAAIQAAVGALLVCGAVLLSADLGAVAADTTFGEKGDLWTETVVLETVSLTPKNPTAAPGDRVTFTAKVPTGTKGTIEYDWTETGTFATLSGSGQVGKSIKTNTPTVDLVTSPSDQGTITVTVTAFAINGSTRTQIGSSQSTVTLTSTGGGGSGLGSATITVAGDPFGSDGVYTDNDVQGGKSGLSWSFGSQTGPYPFIIGVATTDGTLDGSYSMGSLNNSGDFILYPNGGTAPQKGTLTVARAGTVGGKPNYTFNFSAKHDLGGGAIVSYSGGGNFVSNNT